MAFHKYLVCLVICWCIALSVQSQVVYHHTSNTAIYEFLEELATYGFIDVNSAVRPYTRRFIAEKLVEAQGQSGLTDRQQKEIEFYLRDFNKELLPGKDWDKRWDLYYYKDSLFTFSFNPILGAELFVNENNDARHRWNGGEIFGYVGKNVGYYASLRDNNETARLSDVNQLTQRMGAIYKSFDDFSEMRGGVVFNWNWGNIGLVKDNIAWGSQNHGSNILSGRTPSFAQIKLNINPVKWLDFHYIHGWLVSGIVDTTLNSATTATDREVMREKYIAANFVTITPMKNLYLSAGNSIIYSDQNVQPAFLIPFMFFKSLDHTISNTGSNFLGQNSQMFLDVGSRQLPNLHLYTSLFIDEVNLAVMFDEDRHTNFYSWKLGGRYTPPRIPNTSFIAEYTRTNPITFRHFVNTTTFESNFFGLGHYLGDNAEELYFSVRYRPFPRLSTNLWYVQARKGPEALYTGSGTGAGETFLESSRWRRFAFGGRVQYQTVNDGFVWATVEQSTISGADAAELSPEMFVGDNLNVSLGLTFGF